MGVVLETAAKQTPTNISPTLSLKCYIWPLRSSSYVHLLYGEPGVGVKIEEFRVGGMLEKVVVFDTLEDEHCKTEMLKFV